MSRSRWALEEGRWGRGMGQEAGSSHGSHYMWAFGKRLEGWVR